MEYSVSQNVIFKTSNLVLYLPSIYEDKIFRTFAICYNLCAFRNTITTVLNHKSCMHSVHKKCMQNGFKRWKLNGIIVLEPPLMVIYEPIVVHE